MEDQRPAFENPFAWNFRGNLIEIPEVAKLMNKFDESDMDVRAPYSYLMYYVVIAYELALENNIDEALKILERGEEAHREISNGVDNDRSLDPAYSPAFQHLITSTKVHLLELKGNVDADAFPEIPSIAEMDDANKVAARYGFRAMFFKKYGGWNFDSVITLLSEAIERNPSEPLWRFMKEKCLYKMNRGRNNGDTFNRDDLSRLEEILNMERNSKYMSFTAELYRRYAKKCEFDKTVGVGGAEIRALCRRSETLFRECIELAPDYPKTLLECARGFVLLREPFRDLELAKSLLDRVLNRTPNHVRGNRIMAQYYEKMKKPEEAVRHLEICVEKKKFDAMITMIRLRHELADAASQIELDTVQKLENMLDIFEGSSNKIVQILYELCAYFLFVSEDLRKASEYANQIMDFGTVGDNYLQRTPGRNSFHTHWNSSLYNILCQKIITRQRNHPTEHEEYYDKVLRRLLSREIIKSQQNAWRRPRPGRPTTAIRVTANRDIIEL